jgi:hypothetical protein
VEYRTFRSACGDIGLLTVAVFLFPLAILVIGTPVALCLRAAIAIFRWL